MEVDVPEIITRGRDAYEQGINLLKDMVGWTKIRETENGVVGFVKESEDSDFKTFKAEYYINKSPQFVSEYMFENGPAIMVETSEGNIEYANVIQEINEHMKSLQVAFKGKGVVAGRELDTVSIRLPLGDDTFAVVALSVPNTELRNTSYVKANLIFALNLYEPVAGDSNRTHAQTVTLLDPKGSVPAAVVNEFAGQRVGAISKTLEKINSL